MQSTDETHRSKGSFLGHLEKLNTKFVWSWFYLNTSIPPIYNRKISIVYRYRHQSKRNLHSNGINYSLTYYSGNRIRKPDSNIVSHHNIISHSTECEICPISISDLSAKVLNKMVFLHHATTLNIYNVLKRENVWQE